MKNSVLVKEHAKKKKVPFWKIADAIGVCELTISRWLRHELSEDRYNAMMCAIDEIAAGKEKEDVR